MSNLKTFNTFLALPRTQEHLEQVLGQKRQSFVANLTTLVSNDTKLQACEPMTIMYAAMSATALDLPIDKNLGYAFVIPYYNGREQKSEAQFQIGAKGIIQLAMRSGQFTRINVSDVREGEMTGRNRLTGDISFQWEEDDAKRGTLPVVGYVAYFRLVNGFSKTLYMSVEEITAHAQRYSQTFRSERTKARSLWATDFAPMAEKTVLKRILTKYAPLSIEMATAFQADQSVQRAAGEYTYIDNNENETKTRLSEVAAANAGVTEDTPEPYTEDADFEQQPDGQPETDQLPFDND